MRLDYEDCKYPKAQDPRDGTEARPLLLGSCKGGKGGGQGRPWGFCLLCCLGLWVGETGRGDDSRTWIVGGREGGSGLILEELNDEKF